MNIALLGYGKMGKTIERIAVERGHRIVLKVGTLNATTYTDAELKAADVAIEFSRPEFAYDNILRCFSVDVPVVVGTTGWLSRLDEIKEICKADKHAFFYASNFSVGVNIFFRLNETLAKLMNPQPQYNVAMEEIHHVHKLDKPSGTGITLAEGIIAHLDRKTKWEDAEPGTDLSVLDENVLPIVSKRIGEVPGTHTVSYTSAVDRIDITHTAHSREGFALGAVLAAEFLKDKKGIYGMSDLLGF